MAETLMKPKGLGISSPHCGSYLALIGERHAPDLIRTTSNFREANTFCDARRRYGILLAALSGQLSLGQDAPPNVFSQLARVGCSMLFPPSRPCGVQWVPPPCEVPERASTGQTGDLAADR